jgi:hypothetical protein
VLDQTARIRSERNACAATQRGLLQKGRQPARPEQGIRLQGLGELHGVGATPVNVGHSPYPVVLGPKASLLPRCERRGGAGAIDRRPVYCVASGRGERRERRGASRHRARRRAGARGAPARPKTKHREGSQETYGATRCDAQPLGGRVHRLMRPIRMHGVENSQEKRCGEGNPCGARG